MWARDGFDVVVAGDPREQRPVGTAPALNFLAAKLTGTRHRRSKEMLLDPKTGRNTTARAARGVGVGGGAEGRRPRR